MERISIIGLCGAAESGKDESARVLCEEYGYVKRSFAETLRREVQALITDQKYRASLNLPEYVEVAIDACIVLGDTDPWAKPTPQAMRVLLQRYGTDYRRARDEQYWVNAELRTLPTEGAFVYTDVRFPNEVRMIRALGGIMLRVDRPGYGASDHASEQHFQHFDVDASISNCGSIAELHQRVRSLFPLGPEDYNALARQAREAASVGG